jgi:predicted alpha/beta superfamily hydrolase
METWKMSKSRLCLAFVLVWAVIGTSSGKGEVKRFELDSEAVQTRYSIEVVVPSDAPSSGTKYPVVYCMDWYIIGDYLKALPKLTRLGHLIEPCILVGISQGDTQDAWATMRTRDYTPARPTDEYSIHNTYPAALDLAGGAAKFTAFLKDELIPQIDSQYPSDPTRRCFVGYSLGGLLGVHILTTNPELFQYYLLGSPSMWFNEYYLIPELESVPADRLRAIKKVYLSAGEEESWEMLKSFAMVRAALEDKCSASAKLKTQVVDESGHVGAMPTALYDGMRFLFDTK